jgi:hypothetical protein
MEVTLDSDASSGVRKIMLSQTMTNPVGFAWERPHGGPELLWAVDRDQKKVVRVGVGNTIRREYAIDPGATLDSVFFNNRTRRLWALDADGETLYRGFNIDSTTTPQTLVPISADTVQINQLANRAAINGITLDPGLSDELHNRMIWVSRGGGLCSCVELRNPEETSAAEEITGRFFPKCAPVDLSIGPDGKRMWILADNGERNPMVLIERPLYGALSNRAAIAGRPTIRFYKFKETFRPSAIAASHEGVWLMVGPGQSDTGLISGNQNKTYAVLLEVTRTPLYLINSWGAP